MKSKYISIAAAALVAVSGVAGAWLGARLFHPAHDTHQEFHHRLFSELQLNDEQQKLMDAVETRYAIEYKARRLKLAEANRALADVLASDTAYGVVVENAVVEVYLQTCIACHGLDGKGAFEGVPDFTTADTRLFKADAVLLADVINGYQSKGSAMAMPPRGGNPDLTDQDLADTIAYMHKQFEPKR